MCISCGVKFFICRINRILRNKDRPNRLVIRIIIRIDIKVDPGMNLGWSND